MQMWLCSEVAEVAPSVLEIFEEGKKPKQTIFCVVFYFLVWTFHAGCDVAHILHV